MKQAYLTVLVFTSILLLSSCDKEISTTIMNPQELEETWFRSYPNKVWGGHNQPSFERGETHIRITFQENGEFIYNRTVLGLYEGTSIEDTTAIRIWWDSFHEEMEGFEESGVNSNRYMDVTYEIINEELNLVYFTATDLITDEQETPGLDKFEEVYLRE